MDIIIYGDEKDTTLSDILVKALSRYGGVKLFSVSKWSCIPKGGSRIFHIYDIDKLPRNIEIDGIFIFKTTFKTLDTNKFSGNCWHIVDSQNMRAIRQLKSIDQIVITCGTDSKSTLTFSSLTTTEAIINLQRYVKTKNKVLEPHEIPVKIRTPCAPNVLLLVCAILLLSEVPSSGGFEI